MLLWARTCAGVPGPLSLWTAVHTDAGTAPKLRCGSCALRTSIHRLPSSRSKPSRSIVAATACRARCTLIARLRLQVLDRADDGAAERSHGAHQALHFLLQIHRGVVVTASSSAVCKHRVRGHAGEERIPEALDAQHDGNVHVRQRDHEALDLVGHRIRIPIGVRDDVAMLAVAVRSALDVEAHHLRRRQLPRILRAQADADGRDCDRRNWPGRSPRRAAPPTPPRPRPGGSTRRAGSRDPG